jgi:hypothetical protein
MPKKSVSILMLYSALALMLGHNFIGHHHHHDFEHNEMSHHHNDGHQHHNDGHQHDNDNNSEDESDDWEHLFSGIQHGAEGLTFLTSHSSSDKVSKQIPQPTALHTSNFIFQQVIIKIWQNAPPYIADYYNSQNFLPFGLRAPPVSIV